MRRFASALAAAALVLGPSAADAAADSSAASASTQQPSPWLALSMLTPAGTIGLAGAEIPFAKSNGDTALSTAASANVRPPPVPVIAVWLGTVAMAAYVLSREHHGRFTSVRPNSPD